MTIWDDQNAIPDEWDEPDALWDTHTFQHFPADSMALSDAVAHIIAVIKEYLIDLLLKAAGTRLYSADTLLQTPGIQKTYSTDAVLKALAQTRTYTADALLKGLDVQETYLLDLLLQAEREKTYDSDLLLQAQKTLGYALDTRLISAGQVGYTVDLRLGRVFEAFLTDAVFSDWESASWDTDDYRWDAPEGASKSVIWARFQDDSLALSDAVSVIKEILRAYATDLLIQAVNKQAGYAMDALLQQGDVQQAYTIDAFLKELDKARSYTSDALLKALSRQKTYDVDAIIKRLDIARTYALDAILFGAGQKPYSVDLLLGRSFTAFLSDNVFSNWESAVWDDAGYWGAEGPSTDTSIQLALLADSMALTDAVLAELALIIERLLADGVSLSDAIHIGAVEFIGFLEEVFTRWDGETPLWDEPDGRTRWGGEGPARAASRFFRKIDDPQSITDSITAIPEFQRFFSDSVSVGDSFEAFLGAPAPAGSIVRVRVDGTDQLVDLFPISISPTGSTRFNEIKISGGGVIPQLSGKELGGIGVEALFIGTEAGKDQLMADIGALVGRPLKVEFLLHKQYKEGAKARLVTFSSRLVKDGVYRIDLRFKKR